MADGREIFSTGRKHTEKNRKRNGEEMNNHFTAQPLAVLKDRLQEDLFRQDYSGAFAFLPTELLNWAAQTDIAVTYSDIKDWDLFETGRREFSSDDFLTFITQGGEISDTSLFLVSDETIKENSTYQILLPDFSAFVLFYEGRFEQEFFQPLDYLVFYPGIRQLTVLYHEGQLISFSR